jgi:hypothetical protein
MSCPACPDIIEKRGICCYRHFLGIWTLICECPCHQYDIHLWDKLYKWIMRRIK